MFRITVERKRLAFVLSKGWIKPSDGNNFSDVCLAGYLNIALSSLNMLVRPRKQECISDNL